MSYRLTHKTSKTVKHGKCHPMGATPTAAGVNFALYSQHAREVYLLLFDDPDRDPTDIIRMEERTKFIWHCEVLGVKPGQLYAYKIRGDYDPAHGLRFNEHKLLMDPYAKALTGKFRNHDNLLFAYNTADPLKDLVMDTRDNTHIVPKCIVMDNAFDWQGTVRPELPFDRLITYEVHLKGFTAHSSSGVKNPGTYLGFIEKIPYLKNLGINAVELLPIQEFYVEDFLRDRGLTNYWGYNTIGFFMPEQSYSTGGYSGCAVQEFKTMVRELHKAGIEVILDVVYNHSGEGNEGGPTFSFKGIDNPTYYCLTGNPREPGRFYMNYTGCGNSVNLASTPVIRFVMDSLRYWVQEMHVDGFRFDLASVLGREGGFFQKSASFFDAISQDPVLNNVKLIAEPWDLGTYEVGNFPVDWSEWNGKYRDTVRRLGKGDKGTLSDIGWRLTGSHDLYGEDGRSAYNSVNFITCHDGFTLNDLVSYNGKHNEANLENNADGSNDNHSWNCGFEGPTADPTVENLRRQLIKNFACYLFFSLGTPMLLGGDEFRRTQKGNNNAYCQDNDISWFDWGLVEKNHDMLQFFQKAIAFRKKYNVLQRHKFFTGKDEDQDTIADISWYDANLGPARWSDPDYSLVCYMLDGSETPGGEIEDYLLFFILNGGWKEENVLLPPLSRGRQWHRAVDTSLPAGKDFLTGADEELLKNQQIYKAAPRSTVVLVCR